MEKDSSSPAPATHAAGLAGVVVASSSLCFIDGGQGNLVYRGYNIHDLAGKATFEEVAHLLWHGDLPTPSRLQAFSTELAGQRQLPPRVVEILQSLPPTTGPMESLRTGTSLLASFDADADSMTPEANLRKAVRLTAQLPTLLATAIRHGRSLAPVSPDPALGHAANLLWMLSGERPSPLAARAMDTALVLHAEHGFNASTFSARVTASTLADLHSAVVAAISTLKGPLHGGANRAVMATLEEIGSVAGIEDAVRARLERKEKIMGFGHRVYRTMDPRAVHLKEMARELGAENGDNLWFEMSEKMEEVVFRDKGLYPNVDFYSAAAYRSLGIPGPAYPAVFACSRITGWTAHILEQYSDNRLIRPRSEYVGPRGRAFLPLDRRD